MVQDKNPNATAGQDFKHPQQKHYLQAPSHDEILQYFGAHFASALVVFLNIWMELQWFGEQQKDAAFSTEYTGSATAVLCSVSMTGQRRWPLSSFLVTALIATSRNWSACLLALRDALQASSCKQVTTCGLAEVL